MRLLGVGFLVYDLQIWKFDRSNRGRSGIRIKYLAIWRPLDLVLDHNLDMNVNDSGALKVEVALVCRLTDTGD